ncbi:MAG: CocE/NonD family hydrolase [Leptolyngbyaceae cyanobacterium]
MAISAKTKGCLSLSPKQTLAMTTRDGIRLDADIYCPQGEGPFPVLLMRQPYGRAIASTVVYAHPTWYAAHGYMVVIQDVRGRGTSEGEFYPFAHEIEDGFDTVQWAATLPGSNGKVGMYGFSYQGMTQLYAAIAQPPALAALCPAMLAYDLCRDMAYENGAFYWQATLGWAIQLEAETARLKADQAAYQALFAASRNLPVYDPIPTRPQVLEQYAPHSFYFDWLDNPDPDSPYWQTYSPHFRIDQVDLPMLHIGGWFDIYLRGNLNLYQAMVDRSAQPQHLIIGPWPHLPWSRRASAIDFGPAAASPIDRLQIRWFDQFLKGIDTGLLQQNPVQLFEIGCNQWRSFPTFPQPKLQRWYLNSSGLASLSDAEGRLQEIPAPEFIDVIVHDPWRPVPSQGGHGAIPAGVFDRSAIDGRSDVLTYTSPPLQQTLRLAGVVQLELYCSADRPSFDLCAVLSVVTPQGEVFNISQGYTRLEPGQSTTPVSLALQPICIELKPEQAIRLSISAACFPAHAVNSGTGAPPSQTRSMDHQITTVTIQGGGAAGSCLQLPVLSSVPASA